MYYESLILVSSVLECINYTKTTIIYFNNSCIDKGVFKMVNRPKKVNGETIEQTAIRFVVKGIAKTIICQLPRVI